MAKKIFGFTGQLASGKGTATKYLVEKYGAQSYRFSTILRDILDRISIEHSRENLQELSRILRETFGEDILAKAIAEDTKNDKAELIAIDGVRRPMDIKYLREIPGFKLVSIEADGKLRWQRMVDRGENVDDNSKTWEQFQEDEKANADVTIPETMKQADVVIDNNGSLEQLYKQLEELVNGS